MKSNAKERTETYPNGVLKRCIIIQCPIEKENIHRFQGFIRLKNYNVNSNGK